MAATIHVGDIGTALRVTLTDQNGKIVDVSTATSIVFLLSKPTTDGTTNIVSKNAGFYTNGTDGIVQYVTVANDLDVSGTWQLQVVVTLGGGLWHSDISKFKVGANLA